MEESNLGSQHCAAERSNSGGSFLCALEVEVKAGLESAELQLEEMLYLWRLGFILLTAPKPPAPPVPLLAPLSGSC